MIKRGRVCSSDSRSEVVKLQSPSGAHRESAITVEADVIDGCSSEERDRGKVTDEAPTAGTRRQTDRPSALPSLPELCRDGGSKPGQNYTPSRVTRTTEK